MPTATESIIAVIFYLILGGIAGFFAISPLVALR